MNEKERKELVFELSNMLDDVALYADKIQFCTINLMEHCENCAYDDFSDNEKPLAFWHNRERIEKFIEMQNDYCIEKVLPLIEKAQELSERLMMEG